MKKCIALVAHDNCKSDLTDWMSCNWHTLAKHKLVCTGSTGKLVEKALLEKSDQSVDLHRLKSGPLGSNQQLGAMISKGQVDILIFLWDAISVQPHDVDVKALLQKITKNISRTIWRETCPYRHLPLF